MSNTTTLPRDTPPIDSNLLTRDAFRISLMCNLIMGPLLFVSMTGNVVQFVTQKEPPVIGLTSDHRVIEIIPLNKRVLSDADVLTFAEKAARMSFTLDFARKKQQLQQIRGWYTNDGYSAFIREMNRSGNLKIIDDNQLIAVPVTNLPAAIVDSRDNQGRFEWLVDVPLVVNFDGKGPRQRSLNYVLRMTIVRVSHAERQDGVAVDAVNMKVSDSEPR